MIGLPIASVKWSDQLLIGVSFRTRPECILAMGFQNTGIFRPFTSDTSDHEVEVGGVRVSAKTIVVATGSRAAVPPIEGLTELAFLTNRDVFSPDALPRSLAILGAGPIGVELGQAFGRLGSEVTIIDMAERILPRDDEEMASVVARRLERKGVHTVLDARVERITHLNGKKVIEFASQEGAAQRHPSVSADEILGAAGRVANTGELNLGAAGIEAGRGGYIAVDKTLRTRVRRVALHAGGSIDYRTVPWVTYTDPELASVGHTEETASRDGLKFCVVRQSFSVLDRAHAEDATDGLMKVVLGKGARVIGVQIAASGAGELIGPALHAFTHRWKFAALRSVITPYSTMGEVYSRAVSTQLAPKLFNPRARGILRFLFRYRGTGPTTETTVGKREE